MGVFSILPQETDEKQPENNMIENCMIQYGERSEGQCTAEQGRRKRGSGRKRG